ncbi:MAG: amino acid racemase [Limimaricola sp.]|uniref:aspartate/glutamate racemase family protein n=1 Tax=Limimaricola sp. TaxID=2211665 RepID=UPI001D7032C5|nr:amino acid racemase [Limimaricola sp.]MBI1417561.1 amino acid racemase [Limimaricola sp.]
MKRTVGILGGMGPEATVALMARVIAAVDAADDADHIPLLVDQNPQVPSRIARLIEGRGEDPAPVLAMMARRLEGAGACALAMPCNTAHAYADVIRAAVTIPFLDMVQASAAALAAGPVVLMASPAVRRAGVFEGALAGREVIHPDADRALALIRAVKRDGATPENRAAFAALVQATGDAQVLVACTEFSLLAEPGPQVIDTLDVLVREIVAFSTGETHG